MTYNQYPRGSLWRKWDLHVHTPASFHWNGGKQLREMQPSERADSFGELLATIERSDVAVFAFTDYWTFDGYNQFRAHLRECDLSCTKTIFPGIELRVEAPVDYRLNIQVILSDQLTEQQLDDFKSKLAVRNINRRISDEALIEFARTLDASKAKVHGFADPKDLNDSELLRLGAMTIEVTKDSLESAMRSVPPFDAYIVLPYDTSDGLEKLDWTTQPHADNYFMQTAHAFESRNAEVTDLFHGVETEANKSFVANFQKTLNYLPRPVICGSDAHRYVDYGNFPGNRITWIKADPTFQGLRQIFFEPRARVRIQELHPEEKTPYKVIDKVRFVDRSNGKTFSGEWIELNENLNSIIGGKSSGKSLLLYHIAKAIAPDLVLKRATEITIPDYQFDGIDFQVMWKDGHLNAISTNAGTSDREIEFIPQLYVNSLAEKEGRASLYQLIDSILQQNTAYRAFIQDVRSNIARLEGDIQQHLGNLLRLRTDLQAGLSEKKAIGNTAAIQDEIERLSTRIEVLREETGFSPEEKATYEEYRRRAGIQRRRQRNYEALHKAALKLRESSRQVYATTANKLEILTTGGTDNAFADRIVAGMNADATQRVHDAFHNLTESYQLVEEAASQKAIACGNLTRRIEESLKPYEDKINDQKLLQQLSGQLAKEQRALADLEIKDSHIAKIRSEGVQTRKQLLSGYSDLFGCYESIVSMLRIDEYSQIADEIVLESRLSFDTDRFWNSFSDLFDRRSNLQSIFGPGFGDHNDFIFHKDTHIETITAIYEKLGSSSTRDLLKFKRGSNADVAIAQLFGNYFQVDYNIRYKGDDILSMSPGKRGLVLMQLILHISNATHPILMDQPEDNLDNRTISNELRRFVEAKKLTRQIIMITHDANLVVLTDAENIIVSNQAGQLVDRENREHRFEYISGALEHSFRAHNEGDPGILYSCGVREHVCDILEGGEEAFRKRQQRYGFSSR